MDFFLLSQKFLYLSRSVMLIQTNPTLHKPSAILAPWATWSMAEFYRLRDTHGFPPLKPDPKNNEDRFLPAYDIPFLWFLNLFKSYEHNSRQSLSFKQIDMMTLLTNWLALLVMFRSWQMTNEITARRHNCKGLMKPVGENISSIFPIIG